MSWWLTWWLTWWRNWAATGPPNLAEQLVTLADGAASRAMVLGEADYGRHARAAAEILLDNALPTAD
ncbi:hypothetical protein [Streptomyces flavofungini]|uniref:hypothetical protein n=1 Tax=Streptomyces flavofungini TaxID=68200 RepID=UPI0034DE0155